MIDFAKLSRSTPEEKERRAREQAAEMRARWDSERRAKIKHEVVFTRAAKHDHYTTMDALGDRSIRFHARNAAGGDVGVGWVFHRDDTASFDRMLDRLANEDLRIEARGYWRPNTRGPEPDRKPSSFSFEIVEAVVSPKLSHDNQVRGAGGAAGSKVAAAIGEKQVRLPIDDFRLPSSGALSVDEFVAVLRPGVIAGLKLLPQWPAIERLGGYEKWSDDVCRQTLDEARGLYPTDSPATVGQRQADFVTQRLTQALRRMSGVDSSEIGVLVAEARGERVDFRTGREIVAIKLCQALPGGIPFGLADLSARLDLQTRFLVAHPEMRRDQDALRRVAVSRPAAAPWLIGAPDDILVATDADGRQRRVSVNYSAPRTSAEGPSLDQISRFHLDAIVANSADITLSYGILAQWRFSTNTFETITMGVEKSLLGEVMRAARAVWHDNVLAGVLPPEKNDAEINMSPAPDQDFGV